jgi:hypothetical protein
MASSKFTRNAASGLRGAAGNTPAGVFVRDLMQGLKTDPTLNALQFTQIAPFINSYNDVITSKRTPQAEADAYIYNVFILLRSLSKGISNGRDKDAVKAEMLTFLLGSSPSCPKGCESLRTALIGAIPVFAEIQGLGVEELKDNAPTIDLRAPRARRSHIVRSPRASVGSIPISNPAPVSIPHIATDFALSFGSDSATRASSPRASSPSYRRSANANFDAVIHYISNHSDIYTNIQTGPGLIAADIKDDAPEARTSPSRVEFKQDIVQPNRVNVTFNRTTQAVANSIVYAALNANAKYINLNKITNPEEQKLFINAYITALRDAGVKPGRPMVFKDIDQEVDKEYTRLFAGLSGVTRTASGSSVPAPVSVASPTLAVDDTSTVPLTPAPVLATPPTLPIAHASSVLLTPAPVANVVTNGSALSTGATVFGRLGVMTMPPLIPPQDIASAAADSHGEQLKMNQLRKLIKDNPEVLDYPFFSDLNSLLMRNESFQAIHARIELEAFKGDEGRQFILKTPELHQFLSPDEVKKIKSAPLVSVRQASQDLKDLIQKFSSGFYQELAVFFQGTPVPAPYKIFNDVHDYLVREANKPNNSLLRSAVLNIPQLGVFLSSEEKAVIQQQQIQDIRNYADSPRLKGYFPEKLVALCDSSATPLEKRDAIQQFLLRHAKADAKICANILYMPEQQILNWILTDAQEVELKAVYEEHKEKNINLLKGFLEEELMSETSSILPHTLRGQAEKILEACQSTELLDVKWNKVRELIVTYAITIPAFYHFINTNADKGFNQCILDGDVAKIMEAQRGGQKEEERKSISHPGPVDPAMSSLSLSSSIRVSPVTPATPVDATGISIRSASLNAGVDQPAVESRAHRPGS